MAANTMWGKKQKEEEVWVLKGRGVADPDGVSLTVL